MEASAADRILREQPCVGLFGSCGTSRYRQDYLIPRLQQAGVRYYDPRVPLGSWQRDMTADEVWHQRYDMVQTWPITDETYGLTSLQDLSRVLVAPGQLPTPLPRFIVTMVDLDLAPELDHPVKRQASIVGRRIVREVLDTTRLPDVYHVGSLTEMAELSIALYGVAQRL